MAQKTQSIIIPLQFTTNNADFLKSVSQMESSLKSLFDSGKLGEEAYKGSLKELEKLKQGFDDLGKSNGLGKAVKNFNTNLSKNLQSSTSQVKNFSEGFASIEGPIKRSETALDKFGRTLANSLRYNLVNNFVDGALSKVQEVITFLEDVDENLTNIRIVSGKSQSEMNGFLETGMATAKSLGSVTNDYLKASEIYYQQGLSTNEVMERTNATVQAANISNQSVSSTADQATAILNGFNVEASKTVEVLDKIAQVGAGTATDFEEIAKASQKVASSASEANFTIDQTLGMIATISSITREAPETIGTSLNAIIGRFNDLKAKDGEFTSNIEKVLKETGSGLTIFNEETGQMKDIPDILDEIAASWDTLSENAKDAITTQLAGTRQANRLRALLGNYDMYKDYTAMSEDSEGALARQNAIYMESLEAIQNQAQVSAEALYGELLNTDRLKDYYSILSEILDLLTNVARKTGGLQGILTSGAALLRKPLANAIAPSVARWGQNTFGNKEQKAFDKGISQDETDYNATSDTQVRLLRYKEMGLSLTEQEQAEYEASVNILKQQAALRSRILEIEKNITLEVADQNKLENKKRTYDAEKKIKGFLSEKNKKLLGEENVNLISSAENYSGLTNILSDEIGIVNGEIKKLEKASNKASEEDIGNLEIQIQKYKIFKKEIQELLSELKELEADALVRPKSSERPLNTKEGGTVIDSFSKLTEKEQAAMAATVAEKTGVTNAYEILTKQKVKATNEEKNAVIAAANEEIAALRKASQEETKQANQTLEDNKKREKGALDKIRLLGKGADVAKIFDTLSKGAVGLAGGLQIMNVAMDNSLTNSQKLEGALSGLGATLSLLPGVYGAIGTAISVLGPILLEVTGIGQSEFEKLNNKINAIKEANSSLTKNVNQQAQDLASISSTYDDLVKNYKETGATFDQLTEEQKSQYAQVAEYAENYAPELIKYYNTEGQAILDLSGKYEQAANSKKNYLQLKAEENQLSLYSTMQNSASENAGLLVENYGISFQKMQDLQAKIAETRQKGLEGKDVTKELSSLEEQLSSYREQVNSISSDWDEMFSQIILKGNAAFYNLGTTMQNSLLQASSFNSFLLSNEDFTSARFQERIQTLTDALGDLSQEQLDIFNSLNQSQADFFTTLFSNLELTKTQLTQIFSEIQSSQDLLRGGYLTDAINMSQQNVANQVANSSEIGQQYVQNQQYLPEQYSSLESAPLETGGVNISDLKKQNKHLEKQASILEKRTSAVQDITGGAVPSDYLEGLPEALVNYDPDNGIEGMLDDLESIREAIKENQEVIEEYNDANDEVMNNFEKAVRDMAKSGNEGFNEVRDAYEEMYKYAEDNGMDALAEKYGESTEVMEEKMGRMYANLNGDNQEYFDSWVEANTGAILENAANLGVYAEDYKTYAEYMDAVDAARAQTKVYYEMLANGDIAGLSEALKQKKIGDYITEQIAAGNKANVVSFLALSEADQVKYAENEKKLAVLESVRDSLTTAMQGAQGSMDLNAQVGDNSLQTIGDVIQGANSALASIGAPTISFSGNKVKKKVVKDVLKYVKDQISDIKKEQNELKNKGEEASKDNPDLNNFVNDLENIYNGMNSPTYNYPMGGNIPGAKPIGGGGISPNSPTGGGGSGGGGGGGGGGSGSTPKEVEDLELELDPLKRYNDLLDRIDHELDIIKEQKDRVYGKQYLDALNKEVELNRESLKVQQDKLAKIKELEKEQQEALKKQGVEFDENGLISNYNELLKKKQDEANKLSGDAKEDAKEAVEKLQDAMDKYEDEVIDSKRDALKAIEEIKTDLSDLAVEKIQYTIELIVDATEEDTDLIEFIADAQRLKNGKFNFSIVAEESAKQLINSLQGIKDIFAQTGDANKFINDILTNPDLKGNTQAQMDLIKEQQEQMQDLASDLMDFAEELGEAFADGLDEALDLLEDEFDRYENIIGQYEYIIDIAEGLNLDNFDNLNNLYGNITAIYRNNIEQSKQAAEIFKNSRDQFEKGTEEWILANDKYMEMQAQVLDQESELADLLEQKYDTAMESGRLKLEEILFGGKTLDEAQEDLDKINKERKKYLDTETKIYNLSKLERQINKDIQGYQYDPETQAALKKFMNDELKYLNAKEKLTQIDLDLATKQYNVVKARIDLERAYNSEQYQMMLQRNADGTFGYMYVQNTDTVEEAKQAYEDAVNELYQFASEKNDELQQESVDIRSDALDEYDKIVERLKDGTISEEEAVQQLNKAFEDMKKNLEENARAQAEMQQQMASAKLLQILGVSESELDNLDSLEEKLTKTFDILNNNGEVNNLSETIKALGLNAEDYTGTVGEQVSQIYEDLGANEEALEKMMKAFANSGDATAATILGLLQKTGDLSELTQDILNNSLAGAGDSFDSMIDRITSGLVNTGDIFDESFKNGLEGMDELWDSLYTIIAGDLEQISKEFDPENPDGALSQVTNGILSAYEEWQKALKDSYQDIMDRNNELIDMTEEYNKHLQDTINKTNEELAQLTELTKKYQYLREEVLASIDEVLKYIEILDQAKDKIETEGGIHESDAEKEKVEITGKMMYASPYSSSPVMLTASENEFYTDGSVNNKFRVKSADGSYIGWFDASSLKAFHDGGQVDVNKEGLALVKKNEAVFTEQELSFINGIKDVLYDMQSKINLPQMVNSDSSVSQNIQIHASFPNANNADEIEKAFESLYINSSQYINKK